MKTIILSGGLGTRLSEETTLKPKPMVEIGGHPLLWHIMNIYAHHGFEEFVVALGYKGEVIKDYFTRFHLQGSDLTIDLAARSTTIHDGANPRWKVHLIDTGSTTQTGGRIKRLARIIDKDPIFMFTYGDGVANVDVKQLVEFHKSHGRLATVTAVRPPARFGDLDIEGDRVVNFAEKPQTGEGWINGGFFVLDRKVLDFIDGDEMPFESKPMERLTQEGQLMAFRHNDFWQPMDTIREKNLLEEIWSTGRAPWKVWA